MVDYPTSLDTFPDAATLDLEDLDTSPHGTLHGDLGDAVEALEAKVGVDASAVEASHDYQLANTVVVKAATSTAGFGFVIDEDDMVSNLDTKVPTQQSVKARIDAVTAFFGAFFVSHPIADAAGDLLVASANDIFAKLAKGSDYQTLTVNGSSAVAWGYPRALPQIANAQTGTSYTLVLGDAGKLVTLANAAAVTLTVPANSTVAYPVGTVIDLAQLGAGQVTVAVAGGVTVSTAATLRLRAQYSAATLVKTGTDTWVLVGDLDPLGQALNAQTGTTYGFLIGDAWKLVTLSNAAAITATIPANASVPYPIGTHIDIVQLGAGQVTVAITSDTLRATPTAKLRAQYSMATLVKIAATEWVLAGDLAAS